MTDLNVGDRVKIVDSVIPFDALEEHFRGNTGEIVEVCDDYKYGTRYSVAPDDAAGAPVCFYTGEVEKID